MITLPSEDLVDVFSGTRAFWAEARGRRFFLTGGTGFFGRWLLESFAYANDVNHAGMQAVILTRDPARFAERMPHLSMRSDLSLVAGDVREFSFPQGEFHYVIHAAADASAKLNSENPREMLASIIEGTRRVLDFAAQANTRRLLLVSSGAVYGPQPQEIARLPEDHSGSPDPLIGTSAYGLGKKVAEHMAVVESLRTGFEATVARCFAFVGPGMPTDGSFALGNFIRDSVAGEKLRVVGDGSPVRSYLYAAELATWLWRLLGEGKTGRAYNVGSDEPICIADLARLVRDTVAPDLAVEIGARTGPSLAGNTYVPDISRIARELDLRPRRSLAESIARTAQWLKS